MEVASLIWYWLITVFIIQTCSAITAVIIIAHTRAVITGFRPICWTLTVLANLWHMVDAVDVPARLALLRAQPHPPNYLWMRFHRFDCHASPLQFYFPLRLTGRRAQYL
jgi:hypothetical protein